MREYQYYEIRAIDRPLSDRQMAERRDQRAREPSFLGRLGPRAVPVSGR